VLENDKHNKVHEMQNNILYLGKLDRAISMLTLFLLYKAPPFIIEHNQPTNRTSSRPIHHVVTRSSTPAPMSKSQPRNRHKEI
jgi:hypothetical protein